MAKEYKGACLCGAVQFSAKTMSNKVGACHCAMCRKWTGGPFLTVDCGSEVMFTGKDAINSYASSEWAERGFCKKCGSHLFYLLKEAQQFIMPVGLFDERDDLVFDHQIFIDKKPAFYDFSNATHNMTEAEVFALYAPSEK
ncbi:GFA family protein [Janthinobacterium sp. B9-8]|uniref:GFA family protein n=1 Tax=Janthinobacterium sp. B9-8 TaxID=1236179 RepID=UPI00061D18F0|nr:GFA family protein [Janthinobacterium sp. B9-8]AMC34923.1 aldehyde-activating protein [Janthinobacterium sp. B9-8]